MKNLEQVNAILMPKGDNRSPAEQWLRDQGVVVPEISRRCLHSDNRGW